MGLNPRRRRHDEAAMFAARGTALDLNCHESYSEALLALFESALEDEQYRERLERHYALFKSTLPRVWKARTSVRGRVKKKRRLRK